VRVIFVEAYFNPDPDPRNHALHHWLSTFGFHMKKTGAIDLAALSARGLATNSPFLKRRAQGKPDA
jgi:hypothetical protein